MNFYKKSIVCLIVLAASFANAAFDASCVETKYNAMGTGWGSGSDYAMVGEYSGFSPSYAVMKFDVSDYTEAVSETVYLKIEKYSGTAGGMFAASTDSNPLTVGVRNALNDISGWSEYDSSNVSSILTDTSVLGDDGFYYFDVTDIVNQWITSGNNTGLVLGVESCPSGNSFSYIYGIGNADGAAPVLTSVPEPATIGVMSLGALITALKRKRS